MSSDYTDVLVPGPWRHEFVPANGARFHVALAGPDDRQAPLVMLLHSFPQFWWAWRHQLVALGEAGYRVAAMDLRGTGASDKPPLGYDVPTRTRDVAGVIRSLGAERATVVGHGLGGSVAWSMAALQPVVTAAVGAVAAPHPARLHVSLRSLLTPRGVARLAQLQVPFLPERSLTRTDLLGQLLREWGATAWEDGVVDTYRTALQVPFAVHNSLEALRWYASAMPSGSGRRYLSAVRAPISVPALQIHGARDGLFRADLADVDSTALCRDLRYEPVAGAGHFVPEEAPDLVTEILLEWLATVSAGGVSRS